MFLHWELYIGFLTAITLKVTLGVRFLTIEAVVDSKYNGTVTGLMGNFDGDSNNDFVLPNGTILQAEDVISERKIYNNFGQMCNDFRLITNPQFLQMLSICQSAFTSFMFWLIIIQNVFILEYMFYHRGCKWGNINLPLCFWALPQRPFPSRLCSFLCGWVPRGTEERLACGLWWGLSVTGLYIRLPSNRR